MSIQIFESVDFEDSILNSTKMRSIDGGKYNM